MAKHDAQIARLALAESMELLRKIVADAEARFDSARQDCEQAQADLNHWRARQYQFQRAIKDQAP